MQNEDLTIRFYKPGDESQINKLFKAAFHINRSLGEWRWKFQNNPLGRSIIVVGELDYKIVAHFAAIPIGLKIGDADFICYQGSDSMTDSANDTRLIFAQVFMRMQKKIESMLRVHFGFPNKKAHDLITNKLMKGRSIGKIDILSAKLNAVFASYPAIGKREFNLSEVNEFDDRFTHLWKELAPVYKVAVIREREYLNWRYVSKPNNNYKIFALGNSEIKGYIVLKVFENNGVKIGSIIDLLAPRDSTILNNMLESTFIYFNSSRVDLVVCYHRDKFLSQFLSKAGFSVISDSDYGGAFSQMWLAGSNFCPQVHNKIFLNGLNWFVMMGDSDWM
jgi:hypothetical protein